MRKIKYWINYWWKWMFIDTEPEIHLHYSSVIELEANRIRKAISLCKRMEDTYDILDILADLSVIWSHSFQGIAAHDSLQLELYNKQLYISNSNHWEGINCMGG